MDGMHEKIERIRAHLAAGGRARVLPTAEGRHRGEEGEIIEPGQDEKINALVPGNRVELQRYRQIAETRGKWYFGPCVNL